MNRQSQRCGVAFAVAAVGRDELRLVSILPVAKRGG